VTNKEKKENALVKRREKQKYGYYPKKTQSSKTEERKRERVWEKVHIFELR